MYLTQYRAIMRTKLHDVTPGSYIYSDSELSEAVVQAVRELTRVYPKESIFETTLIFDVTDEDWTTDATTLATAISLANSNIKWDSESVKSTDGLTTYTRDTDYYINYTAGTITPIATGSLVVATGYHISYSKLKLGVSIASIASDLLRVEKVEYPMGNVPQTFCSFRRWGDYLYLTSSSPKDSQAALSANKHVAVWYQSEHTPPTEDSIGSFPEFLDSVLVLSAMANVLDMRVQKLLNDSVTNSDTVTTSTAAVITTEIAGITAAITSMSAIDTAVTAVETALAAVDTKLTAILATIDAVDTRLTTTIDAEIAKIATAIDVAALDTALAAAVSALDKVAGQVTLAETDLTSAATPTGSASTQAAAADTMADTAAGYLTTGLASANAITVGADVAGKYNEAAAAGADLAEAYNNSAEQYSAAASAFIDAANAHLTETQAETYEAMRRVEIAQTYLRDAEIRVGSANASIAQAQQILTQVGLENSHANIRMSQAEAALTKARLVLDRWGLVVQAYALMADKRIESAKTSSTHVEYNNSLVDKIKAEASYYRNEFWAMLRDKLQLRVPTSSSSVSQGKSATGQ